MQLTQINGFWLATDTRAGPWHVAGGNPTQAQKDNANALKSFFVDGEGWTLEAFCAMLGNMMGESTINPAMIQSTNRYRLPNNAENLTDVPNEVMQNFYKEYYGATKKAFAIGLVQWDGYTESAGVRRQKLVNYAIVNNFNWYDGWTQCYRIRFEWQNNGKYHFFKTVTINGVSYDFDTFVHSTSSISDLTTAWSRGYERNAGGAAARIPDAEWWYDYFRDEDPQPITPGQPGQADPDKPYNPDDPVDPEEQPIALLFLPIILQNRRKGVKRICLRV